MCTRYYMELSPELRPFIERAMNAPLREKIVTKLGKPMITEGEVRPTDIAPVIAPDSKAHSPQVFPMVWGFSNPKGGGPPLVNCRIETAYQKPLWKQSWERCRCVIPTSYYFEWEHYTSPEGAKKTGPKYMLQPAGCAVTYLAGLYKIEERAGIKIPVFTVLTREPGSNIRFIHERMPVILSKDDVTSWMDSASDPKEISDRAITDLYYEKVPK